MRGKVNGSSLGGYYLHTVNQWGDAEKEESARFWKEFHKIGQFELALRQLRKFASEHGYDSFVHYRGVKNAN